MGKYIKKQQPVEAYQYTGLKNNPGWPKGWLSTKHLFMGEVRELSVLLLSNVTNEGSYIALRKGE